MQWEYASEERLAQRNDAYRNLLEGTDAEEVSFAAVREAAPKRVLEVGCGTGEFAQRVTHELGAEVVATDLSPRMVSLAQARELDARVVDVLSLPFADGEFDCAVANWVLYHVTDVDTAARELARVLGPGGRLVAATLGEGNMQEVWHLVGGAATSGLTFQAENGEAALRPHFARVERRDASGTVVFPDARTLREFVAVTVTRAHLAARVPAFEGPFRTRSAHVVFVADKAV